MQFTGAIKDVSVDWTSRKPSITFTINEPEAMNEFEKLKDCDKLTIKATKFRNKRSVSANGMLWACLGEIAGALGADKWDIYLHMLKRYGKFTYICVKPAAVEAVKAQWRECEELGKVNINGQEAVQMLCYFGSSTYDSKDFSTLLDGVVSEMKEIGLTPPPSQEMQRALEQWEASA